MGNAKTEVEPTKNTTKNTEHNSPVAGKTTGPLTNAQVNDAKAWYASRSQEYTPDIGKQIQQKVVTAPDGFIGPLTIQAIATFQQNNPSLLVDGKAGPVTLPVMFPSGLAQIKAIDRFMAEAKQIQADWAKLKTADERADALLKLVNKELIAAGVPACHKTVKELGPNAGQLDFATWTISLGQQPFSKATLTDEEAADIADTVYHEARHAEQWHMMARMLAGRGKSAKAIATEMGIPPNIASDATSKPLKQGSIKALIAEGWYNSVYGAKAAYRKQVLTDVSAKKTALDKAEAEYDKAPTGANKAKVEVARKQYDAAYEKYKALPEEADAWRAGGAVTNAYLNR